MSLTARATVVRLAMFCGGMHAKPSFSCRSGMIAHRLALPQRSPMPLMVSCTCVAPACTAITELATAISQSLWQWMPIGVLNLATTCCVMAKMSFGKVPPLVSHRHRLSAPASAAALSVDSA